MSGEQLKKEALYLVCWQGCSCICASRSAGSIRVRWEAPRISGSAIREDDSGHVLHSNDKKEYVRHR